LPIQMLTETEAAMVDISDYRFQVKFIFGEQRAFVLDLRMKKGKFLPLDEPASEENFEYQFRCIFEALIRLGVCRSDEKVLCTTFPVRTNLLIFHNVVTMTKALQLLMADGNPIDEESLACLSPYQTEHITLTGSGDPR
jgi:hypothetical protein